MRGKRAWKTNEMCVDTLHKFSMSTEGFEFVKNHKKTSYQMIKIHVVTVITSLLCLEHIPKVYRVDTTQKNLKS